MNLTEHVVTGVIREPYFNHMWCVDVIADSWGCKRPTTVYCKSKAEAFAVKVGYSFEA